MTELDEMLLHFGVKGMKWGIRKSKDQINSKSRTIKKGTTIQNISSREFKKMDRHVYGAYTKADKLHYGDMMGNFMYNERGYKNELKVKSDIKLPSDKELVKTFLSVAKNNPKQFAKDMSRAYNDNHIFSEKTAKHFERKINKVPSEYTKRGEKLAKSYISELVSNKAAKSRAEFFGGLIKKGYDGMSDVNDRDQINGTQDPLIIFNPNKSLGSVKSVKLTKQDLERYAKMTTFNKEYSKSRKDLSEIQR